jgi:hypothetical protein
MPLVDSRRLDFLAEDVPHGSQEPAQHEMLLERASVLEPRDRLLLELTFKRNLTVREIARILERPAGTVSRRLHRLCKRLRDPLVAALIDARCPLTPEYRILAIEYFAQGRLIADLEDRHQIPRGKIRAMLHFVRGWYRGVHRSAVRDQGSEIRDQGSEARSRKSDL